MIEIEELNKKMELTRQSVMKSVEIMEDKTSKSVAALTGMVSIDNDDDNKYAEELLVKVRNAHTLVQSMRKELTDPLDDIKDKLMSFERSISTAKSSDSEYMRVKKLRDSYASAKAAKIREENARIEAERQKKNEISRVKGEMKIVVESNILKSVESGINQLNKMLVSVTLDNYDDIVKSLNYKPTLKEDVFRKWLSDVSYDKHLIGDQVQEIKDNAVKAWFQECKDTYISAAEDTLLEFKSEKFPLKRKELEDLAALSDAEAKKAQQMAKEREQQRIANEAREMEDQRLAALEKARDEQNEGMMDNEFQAQVQKQSIEQLNGVRQKVTYRLSDDCLKNPILVIDTITKMVSHILSNPEFKGIFKRDAQGFPKTDDKGDSIFIEGISYWLKELSRLKIDIDQCKIPNINKVIDTTSIAKS